MTKESWGGPIREGTRLGIGFLTALKEAIEETLEDARCRGDLSPERLRESARDALGRVQSLAEEARVRLDVVPRREFDELADRIRELEGALDALRSPEAGPSSPRGESESGPGGLDPGLSGG